MSQPGATNPRKRREHPTKQLSACFIDAGVHDRMAAHLDAKGLVRSKFIERAIATQLKIEAAETADAES